MRFQRINKLQSEYVVCSAKGNQVSPDVLTSSFIKFRKRLDIPPVSIHELRHTFADLSKKCHVDLDTIKRSLGHSSIHLTSDVYLHDDLGLLGKQIQNVSSRLLQ